jgi:hypothetical protein
LSKKTRVLDYGADGFTTKPISIETIVNKNFSIISNRKKYWLIIDKLKLTAVFLPFCIYRSFLSDLGHPILPRLNTI